MATTDVIQAIGERYPELDMTARPLVTYSDGRVSDQLWIGVPPDRLLDVMSFLYHDPRARFEQLCDLTCVDYLNYPTTSSSTAGTEPGRYSADARFGVVYSLLSHTHNHRLWVKVFVNAPSPRVPSVTQIWKGAEWPEREVYDMFGIEFTGHPDLRRILLPQNFKDYPLRKDYPLTGKGEREDFEVVTRDSA